MKVLEEGSYLTLNKETLTMIYQHVRFLANFRFSRPIETLKLKHVGYETEDFVQEVVHQICNMFKTKKFPTINHLKSMISQTMSYHYLHEKRKYYYTKSRGAITCISLEEAVNDYRKFEDILPVKDTCHEDSIYDLHRLFDKNLYIVYDNYTHTSKVVIDKQFNNSKNSTLLSVNFFIKKQKEYGMIETCKFYKSHGFYMTKTIFNQLSQTVIDYLKDNDILLIEDMKESSMYNNYNNYNQSNLDAIDKAKYTCICGYINKDIDFDNSFWQCPKCGKIHDKLKLMSYNLSSLSITNSTIDKEDSLVNC